MEPKPTFSSIFLILLILLINSFSISSHDQHDATETLSPPLKSFIANLIGTRKGNSTEGLAHLKQYLSGLGYMSSHDTNEQTHGDLFDEALEVAITNYQTYFKLPVNGALDANTVNALMRPRCGVPDGGRYFAKNAIPAIGESHYTFFSGGQKWPPGKRQLTYSFPPGERTDVNSAIAAATGIWAGVSPFTFSYTSDFNCADIKISFLRRNHGDGHPFDGARGILAHAFAPTVGRLHYDADEAWVNGVVKGRFDIQTVGLHELGHILGLDHSADTAAVMFPYIGSGLRKGLGNDDKAGIKALYS